MSDRTTISLDDDVHERLTDAKRDDESWSECFDRLLDMAGEDVIMPDDGANAETNALTADDVPMLVDRLGDEVENRLTRR